jgi:digeranylgeranylglycerophospholipid reductase
MIREHYDVIVVGGGPAGTMAAREAAQNGVSVLLLEKDRDLGIPVRCAEGVGCKSLHQFIEPDPRWIAHTLRHVKLVAPNGQEAKIHTEEVGYILNRRLFDQELGRKAAQAGATLLTQAYVFGLKKRDSQVTGVKVKLSDREIDIDSRLVIGADGVESRVGRWAGMRTWFAPKDFETCYQVLLGGLDLDSDYVTCYFGQQVAPGGYAWVFPKGPDIANVGIGLNAALTNGLSAKQWLDRFVEKQFPQAAVLACVAGGVPCAKPFKQIHGPGFLLAGDAAAHSNPLTGGGIINAMSAGKLAGEIAGECQRTGDWSEKALAGYTHRWEERFGDEQRRYYRLKEAVSRLTDQVFNQAADILNRLPDDKRTLQSVIRTTLAHHPKLLLDIARSFL